MTQLHEQADERARLLKGARRIVVKLGTSTVTDREGGMCRERVEPIAQSISTLMKSGRQVILVSSGAVGLGRAWLGLRSSRKLDVVTKQACAAVGQSLLMNAYKEMFGAFGVKVAQVLLTESDFAVWRRYSNLCHTIDKLLQFGVLPIINENDTVSTAELQAIAAGGRTAAFSDNDRLAALVMSGLEADALALLTNVDGLLSKMPSRGAGHKNAAPAEVISLVVEITPELRKLAAGPSGGGRGGMTSKLEAADIAMRCGGTAVIADGRMPGVLDRVFKGEAVGTAFLPRKKMKGKHRWIAFAADVQGCVMVSAAAKAALNEGQTSLLISGVVRIESRFAAKDVISIVDRQGHEFARGIATCASDEAEGSLGGKKGWAGKGGGSLIVVRRDNIVLM
ncbi:MAG: glutamate 5-kinase [Acidobacteria bacterium]|nr:glutamate 5-kinase [Acidobacteriota bacterium]